LKWLRNLLSTGFPAPPPEVDLHGLRVPEALETVETALRKAREQGVPEVRIICGKGLGSRGGIGVLREAVAGWLEANGYAGQYRRQVERDGRDGAILVRLDS
jgi:DNA-nicking Smr family endonuclease